MSSTQRGYNRHKSDYYITPKKDIKRKNLRICSQSQNCSNKDKQRRNTSGFKGVTFSRANNKWMAQIQANKKYKNLGYFTDKKEAAKAYNLAARKFHGNFAVFNKI